MRSVSNAISPVAQIETDPAASVFLKNSISTNAHVDSNTDPSDEEDESAAIPPRLESVLDGYSFV